MQDDGFRIEIGRRLAEVRKDQKLLQPIFAKKLNISESAYKNYERGDRELPLKVAGELCEFYDVNPSWLLQGIGVKYNAETEPLIQQCEIAVSNFLLENKIVEISTKSRAQLLGIVTALALKSGKLPINEVQVIMKVFVK